MSVEIERESGHYVLRAELRLPGAPEEVFPFFADAGNLEQITPPWLHFRVLTPRPVEMRQGALIDYRLRLHGIPVRWRTEITVWEPPFRFVDEQLRGPYHLWRHEHRFEPGTDGTVCRDVVHYVPIGGPLLNSLFVQRDVRRIFEYRQQALQRILGPPDAGVPASRAG